MKNFSQKVQCSSTIEAILKAVGGEGRSYLLIENRSAFQIYINFGTHADSASGVSIPAGGHYELDRAVPDDDIYFIGTDAALQNINITQGYGYGNP